MVIDSCFCIFFYICFCIFFYICFCIFFYMLFFGFKPQQNPNNKILGFLLGYCLAFCFVLLL